MYENQTKYKRLLVLGVTVLITIGILNWFYTHGFIEITVENKADGENSYVLTSDGGKKTEFKSSTSTVKRLVSKGQYEALVSQHSSNAFAVTKTKGFLGTTKLTLELKPELNRTYVGDNPSFCMQYDTTIGELYSYDCGGSYSNMQRHVAATTDEPTYTLNPDSSIFTVKGSVQLKQGGYVLLERDDEETDGTQKNLYRLKPDFQLDESISLPELNNQMSYSIKPYKQGFVIYDSNFSDIYYYSDIGSAAEKIDMDSPEDPGLLATGFEVSSDMVVGLFTEEISHDDSSLDTETNAEGEEDVRGTSEIIISNGTTNRHIQFDHVYSSAAVCGSKKLCLLGAGTLEVYDITDKPKKLYSIHDVEAMATSNNELKIVRKQGVIALNVDTQIGHMNYSFGERGYCGMQMTPDGYVLCIADETGGSAAILINERADESGAIDKKVAGLQSLEEVSKVSAYRNYIYIAPNVGSSVYLPELGIYGPDPETLTITNNVIDETITKLGIDRSTYTIINPYQ